MPPGSRRWTPAVWWRTARPPRSSTGLTACRAAGSTPHRWLRWPGGFARVGRGCPARRRARQVIGLLFQFPEYQLFEETVRRDVAYGPRNLGLPAGEVEARAD